MSHTDSVETPTIWPEFRERLRRWGVRDFAAALLEALGPLTVLGAQAAFISQPLLSSVIAPDNFQEMVRLLEEPERAKAFVAYLREGNPI